MVSRAVLNISELQTNAIEKMIQFHSFEVRSSQNPKDTAVIVAIRWIQAFFWVRITYQRPEKAFLNAGMRDLINEIMTKAWL